MSNRQPPKGSGKDGLRYPSSGKSIYTRPLNRTKTAEISHAAFAYLFSEMINYAQRQVTDIQDLEKRCIYMRPFPPFPKPGASVSVYPRRQH